METAGPELAAKAAWLNRNPGLAQVLLAGQVIGTTRSPSFPVTAPVN
jgi:hypothetical protein